MSVQPLDEATKKAFLAEDLYDALRWLFVSAVTWGASETNRTAAAIRMCSRCFPAWHKPGLSTNFSTLTEDNTMTHGPAISHRIPVAPVRNQPLPNLHVCT